jgi:Carboxypeptidase regulatory-like domain
MKSSSKRCAERLRLIAIALLIFLVFAAGCSKEAIVEGEVNDYFGQPLQGVTVEITGTRFRTVTGGDGRYSLQYLPGRFRVEFAKTGYHPAHLELEVATEARVPAAQVTLLKVVDPLDPSRSAQLPNAEEGIKGNSQLNLAPNPSFEEGEDYPVGWEMERRGEGTFSWKSARGRTDDHALSIRDIGAEANLSWVTSRFIPIESGHDYEISAWYRNTTQTKTVAFLAIFWGEDADALGSTGIWQMNPTSEWTYRSSVISGELARRSFPGANRVQLSFGGSAREAESGAIWVDDVAFQDVTTSR